MERFAGALAGRVVFIGWLFLSMPAWDQAQISGSWVSTPQYLATLGPGNDFEGSFSCSGAPTCTGTYRFTFTSAGCPSPIIFDGLLSLPFDTTTPQGPVVLNFNFRNGGGLLHGAPECRWTSSATPGGTDFVVAAPGSWDGSRGTFGFGRYTQDPNVYAYAGTFSAGPAAPPVFPMTVTSNIGPTVSSAAAMIQYRPQDVGTTGSVYVFAVAPATLVSGAAIAQSGRLGMSAKGSPKDVAVQCVLAQLTSSGQLQAVSASSLQAFVTGVLGAQGQAVTILDNVLTANIAGAALYVGYGPDALAMISTGLNRRAVSVPGALACDPQPPQTGWWWNPAEGGRGYSIEVAGNHVFFASYLYDVTGRATWLVASGNTSLDGSLFTGNLESYARGQTLFGAYSAPSVSLAGPITLAFNDAGHGTLSWPGGVIPIERFNIVPNGLTLPLRTGQPQGGWWYNPAESGRGFFLEWQGGQLFMAGYMYDEAGNPIWYLSSNTAPSANLQSYANTWLLYGNGQTLTGAWRQATPVNNNVAPVTIQFQGAESALMTLPGGRTTSLIRFRF